MGKVLVSLFSSASFLPPSLPLTLYLDPPPPFSSTFSPPTTSLNRPPPPLSVSFHRGLVRQLWTGNVSLSPPLSLSPLTPSTRDMKVSLPSLHLSVSSPPSPPSPPHPPPSLHFNSERNRHFACLACGGR